MLINAMKVTVMTLFAFASFPSFSHDRINYSFSSIEFMDTGLPVLKVDLYSINVPEVKQTFRFMLDTGSAFNIIDKSVYDNFTWDEKCYKEIRSGTGVNTVMAPLAMIKRISVAGMTRDEVPA